MFEIRSERIKISVYLDLEQLMIDDELILQEIIRGLSSLDNRAIITGFIK